MSYVYFLSANKPSFGVGENIFSVGYYDPIGDFKIESQWTNRPMAAARVHYLNGGSLIPNDKEFAKHLVTREKST
jgi:hypothetical protein